MEQGMPLPAAPCEPHHYRKKTVAQEIKKQRAFVRKFSTKLDAIKKKLDSKRLLAIPTHVHVSNRRSNSHIRDVSRLATQYQDGLKTLRSVQAYIAELIEESLQYQ